jgi:hypothetical protein
MPRLRLAVKLSCAPVWWEVDHNTILENDVFELDDLAFSNLQHPPMHSR